MKTILICLHLFFYVASPAATATFIFKSVEYKMDSLVTSSYNKLNITVNSVSIIEKNKKYKIKINQTALDTITISSDKGYLNQTIVTRLKAAETYQFTFNPCSSFEIIPSKQQERTRLVRIISINRDTTKLFLNSDYCFIDKEQIQKRDTTDYYHNAYSGYCPYSISSFYLCKGKETSHSETDYNLCQGMRLYFAENEMYSLIYDHKSNKMTTKFEGYYNKKIKLKISEFTE